MPRLLLLLLLVLAPALAVAGCAATDGGAAPPPSEDDVAAPAAIVYRTERVKPGVRPRPGVRPPTEPVAMIFSTAVLSGTVDASTQEARFVRDLKTGMVVGPEATTEIGLSRAEMDALVLRLEKDGFFALATREPPGPGAAPPPGRSILVSRAGRRVFVVRDDQLADPARIQAFVRAERTLISAAR